jgi:hypothetical protein
MSNSMNKVPVTAMFPLNCAVELVWSKERSSSSVLYFENVSELKDDCPQFLVRCLYALQAYVRCGPEEDLSELAFRGDAPWAAA